jgi:hypothetical protein
VYPEYGRNDGAIPSKQKDSSFLRVCFSLSAIIIIANLLIGLFSPTLVGIDDEIIFLDMLWRTVVGQRVGIDYHNPLGFGPFEVGALLWHWFGPHYFVMRFAIAIFNLLIAICGCIVAKRTLARRSDLALLFCVTLAFQVSGPSVYETSPRELGMVGFYDRHIVSALAVLFLQTFGGGRILSKRENAIEVALAACLLNIMFLIKISGFLLGLMILLAGCLLRGRSSHRLLNLCAALAVFAAITAIELKVTGLELTPIIQDYKLAAHARLVYSFYGVVNGVFSWPLVSSVALLVLFAFLQWPEGSRLDFRCIGLIIGSYAACQIAVNMTNAWGPSMWLAPAAVVCVAGCLGETADMRQMAGAENRWRRFAPSRLAEISARQAIPFVILTLVLVPEIVASVVGIAVGAVGAIGIRAPYVVTAGKGVSFRSFVSHLGPPAYDSSLNDAVAAIASLKLDHEAIANLDFANPFPVLFLAPPPKGIRVWWDWGVIVPLGAVFEWQSVIGDACVTMVPVQPSEPEVTGRLVEFVQTKLATDFKIVYQDSSWSIYQRTRDCATARHL